jgi:hypothetical protein
MFYGSADDGCLVALVEGQQVSAVTDEPRDPFTHHLIGSTMQNAVFDMTAILTRLNSF